MTSLDVMKGIDMLLIIGLGSVLWNIGAMHEQQSWGQTIMRQMGHAEWEGLHIYDLIFPLFVYMSGVAMNFSIRKRLVNGQSKARLLCHLWSRAAILVIAGWLVNGPLSWDMQHMRLGSVLGLIGISGAMCGTLAVILRRPLPIGITAAALAIGIWAAQQYCGNYTPAGSINATIDAAICPGKLHYTYFDPEGPLCIVSATVLSMLGFLSGWIFRNSINIGKRVLVMTGSGILCLLVSTTGPIIKNIWTPCFVAAAAGTGAVMLAILHVLCDVLPWRKWCYPFKVVGSNALFIYLVTNVIDFGKLTSRLFGGACSALFPAEWQGVALSSCFLLLAWLLCHFLYRRGLFIRL